ncbi:helix-turn-helix domain-containing protein [Nocardia xishanensis]|uniref:helix-turn-helix domain-containing protein n=1 Tax=Nocardia xishanensis TaxID=238964 RepID=UPI000836BED1|nr:helix-turn-helix transcriptional regulator [Nocardia xishanensis]
MSSNADSTLPRRQLGRYLREGRDSVGMTLEDAARLMQWGKSTLQRLERGQSDRVRDVDVKELCRIYGMEPEQEAAMIGLARQAAVKSWWHEFGDIIPANFSVYVGLEASAETLTSYQPDLVPGLLQTADYARVLARAANPDDSEAELDSRVRLKVQRQSLLTRKTRPVHMEVILSEGVLRRKIGTRKTMTTQLRHLADEGTRPNISLRVLPFEAGMPTGDQIGPFVIMDFGLDGRGKSVEPTIVYAENYTGDMYSEKASTVLRYTQAYQAIQHLSLDEVASRSLLRDIAREYERER